MSQPGRFNLAANLFEDTKLFFLRAHLKNQILSVGVLFLLDCETLHTLTFSETSAEKTKLSTVLRLLQKASKTPWL